MEEAGIGGDFNNKEAVLGGGSNKYYGGGFGLGP
jgi:hypothetical protein